MQHKEKEPWVAVTLSWAVPGLGQYYAFRTKKGIIFYLLVESSLFFAFWCVISRNGNTLLGYLLFLVSLILAFFSLVDAYWTARKQNSATFEGVRQTTKDPFLAVFLSWLVPGLGMGYFGIWLLGSIFFIAYIVLLSFKENLFILMAYRVLKGVAAYKSYPALKTRPIHFNLLTYLILVLILSSVLGDVGIYLYEKHYVTYSFIEGNSMNPTMKDGDITLRDLTRKDQPARGDIISFRGDWAYDYSIVVKRLIAFEGESVEIRDGIVYVDGKELEIEPTSHIKYREDSMVVWAREGHPYTVPKGCVFVLGDNSEKSLDSRFIGSIEKSKILGVTYKIIWPLERIRNFN